MLVNIQGKLRASRMMNFTRNVKTLSLAQEKTLLNGIFQLQQSGLLKSKAVNMTTYTEEYIKNKLKKELDATHVEVVDESDGCGGKFSCVIVSEKFQGKPLLQRHRLVNAALEEELKTIHAFSQKTFTPEQWKEKNQ